MATDWRYLNENHIMRLVAIFILLTTFASLTPYALATPISNLTLKDTIQLGQIGNLAYVGISHDESDDTLWLTSFTGYNGTYYPTQVIHIDRNANELLRFATLGLAIAYRGISMSKDNSSIELIGDAWGRGAVVSYSKTGQYLGVKYLTGADLRAASGIAVQTNGNFWVSDFDGAELFEFDSNGQRIQTIQLPFTPGNIAIDRAANNLYIMPISEPYINILNLLDYTQFSVDIPPRNSAIGIGLRFGLAVSENDIYAMDTGWRSIQVFSDQTTSVPEPPMSLLFLVGTLTFLISKSNQFKGFCTY